MSKSENQLFSFSGLSRQELCSFVVYTTVYLYLTLVRGLKSTIGLGPAHSPHSTKPSDTKIHIHRREAASV